MEFTSIPLIKQIIFIYLFITAQKNQGNAAKKQETLLNRKIHYLFI